MNYNKEIRKIVDNIFDIKSNDDEIINLISEKDRLINLYYEILILKLKCNVSKDELLEFLLKTKLPFD